MLTDPTQLGEPGNVEVVEPQVETPTTETVDTQAETGSEPMQPASSEAETKKLTFDDFIAEKSGVPIEAPVVEKKDETPIPEIKPKRDLTGIDEADQVHFKRMSNDAFEKQKQIYLENKELKQKLTETEGKLKTANPNTLPNSYYEHPEAYKLSPEYNALAYKHSVAEKIRNHWRVQQINVSEGGQWRDLQLSDKGELLLSEPKEASKEAKLAIADHLDWATDQLGNIKGDLTKFTEGYKAQSQGVVTWVKTLEDKYFPGYNDEKHATHAFQKDIISKLHPAIQSSPASTLIAKITANNAILMGENKRLREENAKLTANKTEAPKFQPKVQQNGSVAGPKIASFSDFEKALGRG